MFLASPPRSCRRSSLPSDRDGCHTGPPLGHRSRPGLKTFCKPLSWPEGLQQTRTDSPVCPVRRSEITGFRGRNRRSERLPPSPLEHRSGGLRGMQSPDERRSLPGRMIAKKLRPTVSISPSAGSRFQRISCSLPSARSGYVGSVFAFAIIGSVTCGFPDACSERVLESALCPCEFIYFVVW